MDRKYIAEKAWIAARNSPPNVTFEDWFNKEFPVYRSWKHSMIVEITDCSGKLFWYRNKIGKRYVVSRSSKHIDSWKLLWDRGKSLRLIAKQDCKIISIDES